MLETKSSLSIEYRPIESLKPLQPNPRTHSVSQIRQIASSIEEFGFTNPILLDADDRILAGNGRFEAARLVGLSTVPTIRLADLSPSQRRAYVLADNRLAEKAGWDPEILAIEFEYFTSVDVDFDVTITGFETAEIDVTLTEASEPAEAADVIPPQDPDMPVVTRPGDLWKVDRHRVFCADALIGDNYTQLMCGEQAEMVFIDPPFNVPISGHVCGLGKIQHREFAMAAGEMSPTEFTDFLGTAFGHLVEASRCGSIHYIVMDWRHVLEIMQAAETVYSDLKNLCIWTKTNAGMGSMYRSQHELVFVFKNGTAPHINNVELGKHGRYRTNVWTYPGVNARGGGRTEELAMHPTVKPVALVADAIRDCSKHGGLVLDCFGGSGTTLIAAEQTGRRAALMELDPGYVDVTLRRYHALTGIEPIHVDSGLTLDERAKRLDAEGAHEQ